MPIGDHCVANTGRDDRLPAVFGRFRREDLRLERDIAHCPDCGAIFEWAENAQLFGSGNLDEQTLRRLGEREAASVRELLRSDQAPLGAAGLADALGSVEPALLNALLSRIATGQRARLADIVPLLIDAYERGDAGVNGDVLSCYVGWSPARAKALLKQIGEREHASLRMQSIADICRRIAARNA
jgi:hypothetical protein